MSKYLLDTHALLWMISGDPKLSAPARETILDASHDLFFSMAGYWEICIKVSLGKLQLRTSWEKHLDNEMKINGIQILPIHPEHCRGLLELPWIHRDPFDRMMIAQCLVESATLISADPHFQGYPALSVRW